MASHPAAGDDFTDSLPARPHVPARQVLLSAAALWLTYFLLITVRGLVVELGEFHDLLWRRALVTVAGIAITLLAWPVLRRFDGRSIGVRIGAALVIMLPAALALAVVNQQAFAAVEKRMIERESAAGRAQEQGQANAEDARKAADAAAVRVRHDLSGNVLVDITPPLPPAPEAPQAAPEPPQPPAAARPARPPRAPAASRSNSNADADTDSDSGDDNADRDDDSGNDGDLSGLDVSITRRSDGMAEVRVGRQVVVTDSDEAEDVAANLAEAQRNIAEASRNARRGVQEAMRARSRALERARRTLAEAGLSPPGLPAPPPVPRAGAAPPAVPVPPVPQAAPQPVPQARPQRTAAAPAPAARPAVAPRPAASQPPAMSPPEPAESAQPSASASVAPGAAASPAPQATDPTAAIHKSMDDEGLWRQLTDVALGRYFLLIAWAALYLALGNAEMVRAAERREGEYRRAAKAAELRSLRYQVNPHFLFNTLNSLSALVMVGRTEQAEKMIQTISSFYRHSLAGDPTSDVPLDEEIALQRHYLAIEAVRFPERLACEFDVPDELARACVPGMILQPLVENSIKYAVSASTRVVTVCISARAAGGMLILTVADDGPGGSTAGGGTGIGLANVRSRLAARFGDAATVESGPLPAGGYATVMTMPIVRNDC